MENKVQALKEILGGENVLDDAEILEGYSSDISFAPQIKPRLVAKPKSADDVKVLVKWANDNLTSLVPVSSGGPHFRGDTIPATAGEVIADLTGMNKVLRIDARNRVVMIEPGVTFRELIPRLKQEGLKLNLPLLPRASKSVMGSMLEREPVIMPLYQWDAVDPLSCIELVFGTGEDFRTGAAAGPGTLEDQWKAKQAQVCPIGPGFTDFARVAQGAQGTLAIGTWATVKCEDLPTMQKPYLVGADSFEKISDFIYRLLWLRSVEECLVLNNSSLATIMAKDEKEYAKLCNSLPRWIFFFNLAGFQYYPKDRLEFLEESMVEAAQQFGVEPEKSVDVVSAYELLRVLGGTCEEPYWKLRRKGACQDVMFTTTLDRVSGFVDIMYGLAGKAGYPTNEIGIYVQPMVMGSSCHCEFSLFYDPDSASEKARVQELNVKAGVALMNAGAFFSRPYGDMAEIAFRRDAQSTAILKQAKKMFDPNNIMNPGKLCF